MMIGHGHSEIALLASVVKRAFDDIELRYKSSGSVLYAKKAVDWINGSSLIEDDLDKFMSFSCICDTLGWPEEELIELATKLYEGEYDSIRRVSGDLFLPYRGNIGGDDVDSSCDVAQCQGVLRNLLFDSTCDIEVDQ